MDTKEMRKDLLKMALAAKSQGAYGRFAFSG